MNYSIIKTTVVNARGLALACEVYRPEGDGVFPAVLILHGFTGYKEENNLVDIAHRLASMGVVAVRFTASGFGDSEGTLEADYRFGTYRKDADSVYAWMLTLSYIDPNNIGVCGHSMGGKLSILFCADHPEIRAVCAISAPIHLLATSYGAKIDEWKQLGYFEKVSGRDGKSIRVPYAYIDESTDASHDVLDAAKRMKSTQTFVIAGRADETVPWETTKEIFDTINCPKEWLLVEDMDHWYKKDPKMLVMVHDSVIKFFEKYIPPQRLKR